MEFHSDYNETYQNRGPPPVVVDGYFALVISFRDYATSQYAYALMYHATLSLSDLAIKVADNLDQTTGDAMDIERMIIDEQLYVIGIVGFTHRRFQLRHLVRDVVMAMMLTPTTYRLSTLCSTADRPLSGVEVSQWLQGQMDAIDDAYWQWMNVVDRQGAQEAEAEEPTNRHYIQESEKRERAQLQLRDQLWRRHGIRYDPSPDPDAEWYE